MSKRVRLTKPLQTSKIEVIVAHACVVAIRENDEDHKWRKKMAKITQEMRLSECGRCESYIDATREDGCGYRTCTTCGTSYCNIISSRDCADYM